MRSVAGLFRVSACAALLIVFATGCSRFNRDWKAVAAKPAPTDITGAWEGTWRSDANQHTDRLRALISRDTNGVYQARFRARYKKVLHFGYTVPLRVRPGVDGVEFKGTADLGAMAGGVYEYTGRADATNFFSTYASRADHGTFDMKRPATPK